MENKRNLIKTIWMGFAFASAWVSILFKGAGKVSFVFAVIGLAVLALGIINEMTHYTKEKKEK